MTKKIIIFISFATTIISCGPRSGISYENDTPVCAVSETTAFTSPRTESETRGEKLFINNCRQCHAPASSGPKCSDGLRGVCDRIPKDRWFSQFIQDSDSLKKTGDPYALKIDDSYQTDYEHKFTTFTDDEIDDLYNFLRLQ